LALSARRRTHGAALALVAALALIVPPAATTALSLPEVITGLSSPVYVTGARDGTNRLFVVEQGGRIKAYTAAGTSLGTFLNISNSGNLATGGERGLLGLAFHPNYETNRKFYVYFTRGDGDIAINEYKAQAGNANRADMGSRRRILTIEHSANSNHNGGQLAFGPDGYLYIGTGDGGGSGDAPNNAQNKDRLLGKILRININGTVGSRQYKNPASNPFVGKAGRNEIWSYGLRNPWKFSFDRARGDLWIGDVGQNRYEEINRKQVPSTGGPAARGSNFGWRVVEGRHCYRPSTGCSKSGKVVPVVEYSHDGGNCSVTGGYVYRGSSAPLVGKYIFADFCSGKIWSISRGAKTPATKSLLRDTAQNISSFGEGDDGELYMVSLGGTVYRVLA
jgi:glucose/arabinose dehydrogenase